MNPFTNQGSQIRGQVFYLESIHDYIHDDPVGAPCCERDGSAGKGRLKKQDLTLGCSWDQVLIAEEREFSYWDWTPAGTTTHDALVTEQNQTFDLASFTYLTWEQGADGEWQQVEKEQSYQIEQWYTSETELPYTVQEWEKTLKKVTYEVHHTEWVKKEVMGTYPVFERYKIYYGQTKYVYETEYVPVDYTTALIGKVLKTVDYSTTILGTEAKELNYDTPLIGTVTNRIEYDVTERSECEDCDPEVYRIVEDMLRDRVDNIIGQMEAVFDTSAASSRFEELLLGLNPWSSSEPTYGGSGPHSNGRSTGSENLWQEKWYTTEGSIDPIAFSPESSPIYLITGLGGSTENDWTSQTNEYGTRDVSGSGTPERGNVQRGTNASGGSTGSSRSGSGSGKATGWVDWISNHLFQILFGALIAIVVGIIIARYGSFILAIIARLLVYGTIIWVLWKLSELLEEAARYLEELAEEYGYCQELAKALRRKAEFFRQFMKTCMDGYTLGAEIFIEALKGFLQWLRDMFEPASK